jgi:hypothetical protein
MFKNWLHLMENQQVSGGITSRTGNPGTARYTVTTPTGSRSFIALFALNGDELHINFLGDDSDKDQPIDKSVNIMSIMNQFANDVCRKFGPVDPTKITYTPATGGTDTGAAVRDRLFQRYIRQLQQNLPNACQKPATPHLNAPRTAPAQSSKYASHPLRGAFKGSDEEFASFFGL